MGRESVNNRPVAKQAGKREPRDGKEDRQKKKTLRDTCREIQAVRVTEARAAELRKSEEARSEEYEELTRSIHGPNG